MTSSLLTASLPSTLPWLVLLFAYGSIGGAYYDIWWHVMGRVETFLTPPHSIFYSSIFLACITVFIYVAQRLAALGRFAPAKIACAPALALAGTGSLVQLVAGVSHSIYHQHLGYDITLWSPPHMLAVYGGIVLMMGASGLFLGLPESNGRWIGYTLALGGAMSALLFGLTEYDIVTPSSLEFRWVPHGVWYSAFVGVFGVFLLAFARRQFQTYGGSISPWEKWLGTAVMSWALLVKVIVYVLCSFTPAPMRMPILFIVAGLAHDLFMSMRDLGEEQKRIVISGMAFVLGCVVVLLFQAPVTLPTLDLVVGIVVSLAAVPVAAYMGQWAADVPIQMTVGAHKARHADG